MSTFMPRRVDFSTVFRRLRRSLTFAQQKQIFRLTHYLNMQSLRHARATKVQSQLDSLHAKVWT
jgi:hypothetical protein